MREGECRVTRLFAWTVRATALRWSGPGSGGGGAGRGGGPWCYTASGHWGGALGSITAVIMGLYIFTSHHYSGDFQTNAEVEKQVPGTHTLMNYRTKTLTLLEIKTAGCGYLNNCHTRQILLSIILYSSTQPRNRHFVVVHILSFASSLLIKSSSSRVWIKINIFAGFEPVRPRLLLCEAHHTALLCSAQCSGQQYCVQCSVV